MTNRSAAGRKSKRKGKTFEQLIARMFNDALGTDDVARGWWQAQGGDLVPDVIVPGLWVQCGHGSKSYADGHKKLAQAVVEEEQHRKRAAVGRLIPIAVTRVTRERAVKVTIHLLDLVEITYGDKVPGIPHYMREENTDRRAAPLMPNPVVQLPFEFFAPRAKDYIDSRSAALRPPASTAPTFEGSIES